ncbi:MAG: chromate efflux transporter [Desulfococcaceae bacterium]
MDATHPADARPDADAASPDSVPHPSFAEAFKFWLKLGFVSFGGPAGQIGIMHQELVERRRWIGNDRFLGALNYCMLLPGPEAQQLATYIGWLLHRTPGGLVAGGLFVLPSAFLLFALSYVYAAFGELRPVEAVFRGLEAAVLAIVCAALLRMARNTLTRWPFVVVAAAAFVGLFVFGTPFPVVILGAGLWGLVGCLIAPNLFQRPPSAELDEIDARSVILCPDPEDCHIAPSSRRGLTVLAVCLLLWIVPAAALWIGARETVFFPEAMFFTKAAFLTFGGAYAVLAYMAQAAVEQYGWLTAGAMMDGLGLAETTPGPLIMVVQFVGFMGGWNLPGNLNPLAAGLFGSAVATYFTFLPCFLFIFLGAPYIEKLRSEKRLEAALSGITAAVVGVMLNLAVWFGRQALILGPGQVDLFALAVTLAAFAAIRRGKVGVPLVVLLAGIAGLGASFIGW